MRPLLKPALRRIWRDATTLQMGLDPEHAVIISGLDPATAGLVDSLDGTHDLAGVASVGAQLGLPAPRTDELIDLLTECGVLEDGESDRRTLAALSRSDRDRLAPDLAAASLARGASDGGMTVLGRRREAVVTVHGAGRVGASITTLLAASGLGCVVVHDDLIASSADVAPAGLATDDVGARRQDAAARATRRVTEAMRHRQPRRRRTPDVAVIADDEAPDPTAADAMMRAGVAHLFAGVRETTGLVGPLVLPGRSSCRRCHDLHRRDRDPAWPGIAAQLRSPGGVPSPACDVLLATAVAAHAAIQVVAFVDGAGLPPAVDGTLEISQSDGLVRRRSWRPHPACGCGWWRFGRNVATARPPVGDNGRS